MLPDFPTNLNQRLLEIFTLEPRLQAIFDAAYHTPTTFEYDRIHTYYLLKRQIVPLVGWRSNHPALQNSADYQLVLETLLDLLPLDRIDRLQSLSHHIIQSPLPSRQDERSEPPHRVIASEAKQSQPLPCNDLSFNQSSPRLIASAANQSSPRVIASAAKQSHSQKP